MAESTADVQPRSTDAADDADRGTASGSAAPAEAPAIVDVWSRTHPKYRVRAVALLVLNIALFGCLCVFTHWLHTAELFTFTWSSYFEPGRFWDSRTPNLNDFILYPINVVQTPIHGVVLGLLVASIVAVPILIAILYRFPYALPFIACVLLFAHMPWMAVTLIASCVLASVRPFRLSFRFGAGLVGLLPIILYLYLATRGDNDELLAVASPTQKALFFFPWVLALLAASAMMAVVLLIARAVNYRPGAVAPVVAVMFATPFALFHVYVGADELVYRVLERHYGPQSERFNPVQDPSERIRTLLQTWIQDGEADRLWRGVLSAAWGGADDAKRLILRRLTLEYLADRADAEAACRTFLADHLRSRYEANVLYLQARTLDTRLDERRLAQTPPRRELYSDFPHGESAEVWATLLTKYPESPLATAAALRLAQLRLRQGDVDAAADLLQRALRRSPTPPPTTQPRLAGWLRGDAPETSLRYDPEPDRREAWRLSELIRFNRDDRRYGDQPLVALAALDPHRERYLEKLAELAERFPDAALYDDLRVSWAAALPDPRERVIELAACAQHFGDGSAAPQALFLLADLELLTPAAANAAPGADRRSAGMARMRDVATRFAGTYWGHIAAERLGMLERPPNAAGPETVQR